MKKILKKFSASLAAIILMASSTVFPVSAQWINASTTAADHDHTSFKSDWKEKIKLNIKVEGTTTVETTMTIGFDTWAEDEDYVEDCWAPTGWKHYAKVRNSKGATESTNTVNGGFNSGKADVKHTGNSVIFYGYVNV